MKMYILLCVTAVLLIANVCGVVEFENYKKENNERFANNETKVTDLTNRLQYLNNELASIYKTENEMNYILYNSGIDPRGGFYMLDRSDISKESFDKDNEANKFCSLKSRLMFIDNKINKLAERNGIKFDYTVPLEAKESELILTEKE